MGATRSSVVRGGEVDSSTTRLPGRRCGTMASVAAVTALMSARLYPSSAAPAWKGVGTAIMNASAETGLSQMVRLPDFSAACTRVRSPGS